MIRAYSGVARAGDDFTTRDEPYPLRVSPASIPRATYRELLAQPSFARLSFASLLARLGGSMWSVAIVLFVLESYHSPSLAGLVVLLSLAPGLLISPLAGAALDRWGRVRLIGLDYAIGVATVLALVALSAARLLSSTLLLTIVTISSVTVPLGFSGTRSMFPMLAPERMWDRANALDSGLYSIANISGPAAAGLLVAALHGQGALLAVALIWAVATVAILGVREPARRSTEANVLADAWEGLRELLTNPVLRALTLSVPLQNVGRGLLVVALPVFVLRELRLGPDSVGELLSAQAVAGLAAAFLVGLFRTDGREKRLILAGYAMLGACFGALAFAPSFPVALLLMFVAGLSAGPVDVPMFSLRQRSVDAGLLGRVLAVSMSVNFLGSPIGSGLGGPISAYSSRLGLLAAGIMTLVAAVSLAVALPGRDGPRAER